MEKLITIIIPIYEVEKYLHRCVNSVLAQTYTKLEVILVDDGSPDNCGKICDEYAKKDDRVRVIHKSNGGQAEARNFGIDMAQGDYLGFVDGDDWLELDMYEKLYEALIENHADLSMCGLNYIYKKNVVVKRIFDKQTIIKKDELIRMYFTEDTILSSPCNKLYKKELFEHIRYPVGKVFEDRYISLELFSNVDKAVDIGKAKYNYLRRNGSTVNRQFNPKFLTYLEIAENEKLFINEKYSEFNHLAIESPAKVAKILMVSIAAQSNFKKNKEVYNELIEYLAKEIDNMRGSISKDKLNYYKKICKHRLAFRFYCRFRHIFGRLAVKLFPSVFKMKGELI